MVQKKKPPDFRSLEVDTSVHVLESVKNNVRSKDGTVARTLASHQFGLSLIPRFSILCGLSLLLILVLPLKGFSPGPPFFPTPHRPTFRNSNLVWKVPVISALH